MQENKYRWWDILNEIPEGWVVDKTVGSPCPNTVFITNGKSVLKGQKRALLRVSALPMPVPQATKEAPPVQEKESVKEPEQSPFPAKQMNELARKTFELQLLKDIMFDLQVCEIEGWDKGEYIRELKKLINSIKVGKKKAPEPPNLFTK